jgi:hypothetical protein
MIAMQLSIVRKYKSFLNDFTKSGVFASGEITYIKNVFTSLLDEVTADISKLTDLITDGALKMNDAERTKRINDLYIQTSGQYQFIYVFGDEVKLQEHQRNRELQDLEALKKIF